MTCPDCKETLEETRRAPPAMKTVTVMGKPECEEVRHQYAVQLTASPESQQQEELPHIAAHDEVRATKTINKKSKPLEKHSPENNEQRADKVHSMDDQNLRYLKLSSLKQELQTEKTYYASKFCFINTFLIKYPQLICTLILGKEVIAKNYPSKLGR